MAAPFFSLAPLNIDCLNDLGDSDDEHDAMDEHAAVCFALASFDTSSSSSASDDEDDEMEDVHWHAHHYEEYNMHVATAMSILSNARLFARQHPETVTHMSQLLPHLYIGDSSAAMDCQSLAAANITAVVNCATSETLTQKCHYPTEFHFLGFDAKDSPEYDILGHHFAEFCHFVDAAAAEGQSVLVHCHAGVNRSATLCVAYYMLKTHCSLNAAIEACAKQRPIILRNEGFVEQLVVFASEQGLLDDIDNTA